MTSLRSDGRRGHELREPQITYDIVPVGTPGVFGSACYRVGGTTVLASVRTPANGEFAVSVEFAEAVRCRSGKSVIRDFLFDTLHRSVEAHGQEVHLAVFVLSEDGAVPTAALNACVHSLAQAGIPLAQVPIGVTTGIIRADMVKKTPEELVLDPTAGEERRCSTVVHASLDSATHDVLGLSCNSYIHHSDLIKLLRVVQRCTESLYKCFAEGWRADLFKGEGAKAEVENAGKGKLVTKGASAQNFSVQGVIHVDLGSLAIPHGCSDLGREADKEHHSEGRKDTLAARQKL